MHGGQLLIPMHSTWEVSARLALSFLIAAPLGLSLRTEHSPTSVSGSDSKTLFLHPRPSVPALPSLPLSAAAPIWHLGGWSKDPGENWLLRKEYMTTLFGDFDKTNGPNLQKPNIRGISRYLPEVLLFKEFDVDWTGLFGVLLLGKVTFLYLTFLAKNKVVLLVCRLQEIGQRYPGQYCL